MSYLSPGAGILNHQQYETQWVATLNPGVTVSGPKDSSKHSGAIYLPVRTECLGGMVELCASIYIYIHV